MHPTRAESLSQPVAKTNPLEGNQDGHKTEKRTEYRAEPPRAGTDTSKVDRLRARQDAHNNSTSCKEDP